MKKTVIIISFLIPIILASYYFYQTKEIYGNDKESIMKVIKSLDQYKNQGIEIIEINDFGDVRIVGFLSDQNPSYIEFTKNERGNFTWSTAETKNKESFTMFFPLVRQSKMMFVTNYESEIAKVEVDINGKTLEQTFNPNQATVTWVDLPPSDHH